MTIPTNRIPTHPGQILLKHFLEPMGLTQQQLADHIGVPIQRINTLINGKRGISPETAWLLAEAFGNSAQFWINLQTCHDLAKHRPTRKVGLLEVSA